MNIQRLENLHATISGEIAQLLGHYEDARAKMVSLDEKIRTAREKLARLDTILDALHEAQVESNKLLAEIDPDEPT